ncbi:MAG TPA: polysaccharide deacetylase family protein [Streptosporangiaceae bacterium]|nr:polysaccharide deacetylase family protein [Streptosporangiaceae bacterium]
MSIFALPGTRVSGPAWRAPRRRVARDLSFAGAAALAVALVFGPVPSAASAAARDAAARAPAAAAAKAAPTGLTGRDWTAVRTSSKIVALTFDAGANADGVASILATLTGRHVPATFMLTGNFVKSFPAKSRAIVAAGELVGDHSVTHPYFTKLTDAQMRSQVRNAQQQIISTTGADPWPWFRFPYGDRTAHTISVVNGTGFVPVRWTVDTLGWKGTSGGITVQTVVNRVLAGLKPGEIVLMHCGSNPDDHSTLDADALPTVISALRARGYSFVTLNAMLGYRVVLSGGQVHQYGATSFGSLGIQSAGVKAVGIAADHATGGYWILKSNGGVKDLGAPWSGSLAGQLPAGVRPTAIAAGAGHGYFVLTSDGDVHAFGATGSGSDLGVLPVGVTAVGLAVSQATGGYWLLRSDGAVDNFNAPALGSLAGSLPARVLVTGIAAAVGGGYYVLTSDGDVHAFGAAGHGDLLGKLPAGVTAVALATDQATGGYWVLKSNGGVSDFSAPWYGSLAGKVPAGQKPAGIAGQ